MAASLQQHEHGDVGDEELLARVRAGDNRAFEQLFRRYAEPLYDCAYGYVGSRDVAQDVVQQLFVTLWERRRIWQVSGTVATYLYRAVRNGSLNALRSNRRRLAFGERISDVPGIEQELEAADLARAVARIVARLPERCREVFRLNRYHHLTYAEVAEVLNLSVKTVENHMARSLRELRSRLKTQEKF
ncbi:MAG TPA: RNA polymerase sigma-70 factor [Gemmatimonadaceae bacterium]|nr:RNA polymerase sigma-70 factor [Gemmatimonadaceae bacterium]